jgi:hypothetical protein
MTLDEVDALLTKLEKEAEEYERKYDPYNNPLFREVARVRTLREFVACGVPFEDNGDHVVLFDKYIATLKNKRWRVIGKGKWYYYKNAEDLLTRYILPSVQQENKDTPNEY